MKGISRIRVLKVNFVDTIIFELQSANSIMIMNNYHLIMI